MYKALHRQYIGLYRAPTGRGPYKGSKIDVLGIEPSVPGSRKPHSHVMKTHVARDVSVSNFHAYIGSAEKTLKIEKMVIFDFGPSTNQELYKKRYFDPQQCV